MGSGAGFIGVGSPDGPGFAVPPTSAPPTTAELEEHAAAPDSGDATPNGADAPPAEPRDTFARAAGAAGLPTTLTIGLPVGGVMVGLRPLETEMITQIGAYLTLRARDFSLASAMLRTGEATHASLRLTARSSHVAATLDTNPAAQDVRLDVGSSVGPVSFNLSVGVHAPVGENAVDADSAWLSVALPTTTFDLGATGSLLAPERFALWASLQRQLLPGFTVTAGASGSAAGVSANLGLSSIIARSSEAGTVSLSAGVAYDGTNGTPSVTLALASPGVFALGAAVRFGDAPSAELRVTVY